VARLARAPPAWSNCRIAPNFTWRRSGLRLLAAAAGLLFVSGACLTAAPAGPAGASAAGPSGPCGPAGQPCTWNFDPDAGSTHGADVYAGQAPGREGAGVLVAVIDTWVDFNHPDFTGRVVDEAYCIGGSCKDHSYVPDSCTHGTHVSGTIASASYGVAPEADILAVQVLNDGGQNGGTCSGSTTDVANGINFAVAHHAKVINLSLGGLVPGLDSSSEVTAAVQAAAEAGAVVVFAAGNSSLPFTDSYGGDALLVAATGPDGSIAGYSNSGGSVSLAAPGGDDGAVLVDFSGCAPTTCILSTLPGDQYGLDEGTSMAAPHVSGAAALLFGENPGRSRDDVIHALESTAHPLSGAGSGLLDVGRALGLEPPAATGGGGAPQGGVSTGAAHRAVVAPGAVVSQSPGSPALSEGTPPTTAPPSTVPAESPSTVATARGTRSAAGPAGPSKTGSVAFPGAVAAALLLAAGAGSALMSRRRRPR
jgi:subtilisin family serine protease